MKKSARWVLVMFVAVAMTLVGAGYAADEEQPAKPKDIKVVSIEGKATVCFGDEMIIRAGVCATGMDAPTTLMVELLEDGLQAGFQQEVKVPATGAVIGVLFSHKPRRKGKHIYQIVVEPKAQIPGGDHDAKNNRSSKLPVNVVQRNIRVLIVEAHPRWEYRFLRFALERDVTVGAKNLKIFLARPGIGPVEAGGVFIAKLPTTKEEMQKFDLFIIGDIARSDKMMSDKFLHLVADRVQHDGAGLIVIAGRHNHHLGLLGSPLASHARPGDTPEEARKKRYMLPVELINAEVLPVPYTPHPFTAELTPDGATHEITRLVQAAGVDPQKTIEQNREQWKKLPKLRRTAGVGPATEGAKVLLVHPDRTAGASKMPILAVRPAGKGKVMFCGTDDTWRWRKATGAKWHTRFWSQTIRRMAR